MTSLPAKVIAIEERGDQYQVIGASRGIDKL
jgi:hypothetical protein